MYQYSFGKRSIVEESQKIGANECVRKFLIDPTSPSRFTDKDFDLNNEENVKSLIEVMELMINVNLSQEKYGEVKHSKPNKIQLTYTRSNLGKGYIFWFRCNLCDRRVRYLYIPPNSDVLACRKCHRLAYSEQNESKRFRGLNWMLR